LGDGRSTSGTDIRNLIIGDKECATTDIIQSDDTFNGGYRSPIECKASITQVAGEYDFTEFVVPGYARKSIRTQQTSFLTNKNYTQRVLAQISSVSANQVGSKGQVLTVKGNGFSTNTSNYTCTAAGETCTVTSASATELTVTVPEKSSSNTNFGLLAKDSGDSSTQVNGFLGGHGAKYQRFDR